MTDAEKKLIMDYMIRGENVGNTDVFEAVDILIHMNGNDIISVIMECQDIIRPIVTGEIPQFSEEKDVFKVLRVLIDSGLEKLKTLTFFKLSIKFEIVKAENHYEIQRVDSKTKNVISKSIYIVLQ